MITREMETYAWTRPSGTVDEYGQSVSGTTPLGNIDAAIYFEAQINLLNPLYVEATHIGLTTEKNIELSDKIGDYKVLQVNPIGRLNQLILKQV